MQYDIVIIGSGPGGYVAAIRASQLGLKTAIIEKAELGGVCLNWGCIPTKALLKSANVLEYIKHAADYGVQVSGATHNFSDIIKRSREVAGNMSKGVSFLMKKNKIDVIQGKGRVLESGKTEVLANDGSVSIVESKHIILATGSRNRELPGVKVDGKNIIGYREAMSLQTQPDSIVILGAGAIGCEFAYFYHTIGTKVTLVEFKPDILPIEDHDVSRELSRVFRKKGIDILTSTKAENVLVENGKCKVSLKSETETKEIICDVVLSAVGVQTNLESLWAEKIDIKTENGKIITNDFYHTNVTGIYAIGDIVNGPALAHVASAEGIICVEKIAGHNPTALNYSNIPGCVYASPEVASVGLTEKQAKESGYEIKVGKFPFSASGKASAAGAKEGFVKVIFDAKYGEFLGAHMIGANVTEMIAEVVVARNLETTATEILKSVHPHPTMSEALMEATAQAYNECIHL